MPRVLIVHYSRTGHTAKLAQVLADEMRRCGYAVDTEAIRVVRGCCRFRCCPCCPFFPST
jgi:menaquinone-dependent protoporphyrinogen IX oxidase